MDLVLHSADEGYALATFGPFVIVVWRGAPTQPRVEATFELLTAHTAAMRAPVGKLAIIEDGAPPPTGPQLELARALLRREPPVIAAMAGAFEAKTPRTNAVHEAAEGIGGWIGLRFPVRACFDVDEACAWITRRITPDADAGVRRELAYAVEGVRSAIGSGRPIHADD